MTKEELKELNAAVLERVKQSREGNTSVDEKADVKYEEIWEALKVFESIKTRGGSKITRNLFNSSTYGGRIFILESLAKVTRNAGYLPNNATAALFGKSVHFRPIPVPFTYIYWAPLTEQYYVGKMINTTVHVGVPYECLVDAIEKLAEIVGEI